MADGPAELPVIPLKAAPLGPKFPPLQRAEWIFLSDGERTVHFMT